MVTDRLKMEAILFVLNIPNCNREIIKRLIASQRHGNLTPPSSSELPPLPATSSSLTPLNRLRKNSESSFAA